MWKTLGKGLVGWIRVLSSEPLSCWECNRRKVLRLPDGGHYVDCPPNHHPCRGIADVSGVTKFSVSSNAVKELAAASPAFPAGYMRIFVAPQDSIYGMARMFQMLGEKTRPDLYIVRTMDAAYHLLRVESPEFCPIS